MIENKCFDCEHGHPSSVIVFGQFMQKITCCKYPEAVEKSIYDYCSKHEKCSSWRIRRCPSECTKVTGRGYGTFREHCDCYCITAIPFTVPDKKILFWQTYKTEYRYKPSLSCPNCKGTGEVAKFYSCTRCHGAGYVKERI